MDRIYPEPTIFIDDSEPDLNAENLNKITNALSDIDKRVAVDVDAKITANENAISTLNGKLADTESSLGTAKTDISNIKTWLMNGRLWISASSYTDVTIDGTKYLGTIDIVWINLSNGGDRRILIGFVTSTNNGDAYGKFITTPRLIIQNTIAGTWSSLRSI